MNAEQARTDSLKSRWTLAQLADWLNVLLPSTWQDQGDLAIAQLVTDSRTVKAGDVYIAIEGPRFDGHHFIAQAIKQGAVACIISNRAFSEQAVPCLVVADTTRALGRLGQAHRRAAKLDCLVAVTGSNGKTTVKELLAALFATKGATLATQGNLNNQFGVPRTLLSINDDHRYAVIEMGANHQGEIDCLTRLAEPDIAVITLAAPAHLEGFGSLDGIIAAKGEIMHGIKPDGVGIINTDSPGFNQWQEKLNRSHSKTMSFGQSAQADVQIRNVIADQQGVHFELYYQQVWRKVTSPLLGAHNAYNLAAGAAVAQALGWDWEDIAPVFAQFTGTDGRLQTYQLGALTLIDDSYNANPSSMAAGLDSLHALASPDNKPMLACLGTMAELGGTAVEAHFQIGQQAARLGVNQLWAQGSHANDYIAGFKSIKNEQALSKNADHAAMIAQLFTLYKTGEPWVVLIKGSRSAAMDQLRPGLTQRIAHAHLP
ncbi:UDP-N-acetylmuramoyl-tripeptide--D-alanyl-D-alanine ligase [Thiomicrospira sp. ALE5]|uniref:UDP-N-acetylmuramoyl-tripeptide--D-alanyl-D- alanine ligase n=1 Tax=Thiomicrospira sp. ALE5 TaxID=748650 RepID=UPI0008ECF00A|nr:UDP-N-acetylmuramoyl-tripeptide--D-alanyl-D-alanine ligase [Thiomicrospira sp. ALE5]SFR60824.1 UDP-N-acetylmuramoyl-tripeptide--D-alanyl-D-alanine ligase [Thiomicrospira sp. ALE5]